MLVTLVSFLLALGVLVAIHEYGHYRVAVACGVKVLQFSIGFGKPIYRWRLQGKPTEFVIGALPLGGFVKMLDEREGTVDAHERHLAFNNQVLSKRMAIVAAGPLANLLLAVVLFSAVAMMGQRQILPIVAAPVAGSLAAQAGVMPRDEITQLRRLQRNVEPNDAIAQPGEDSRLSIRSFEELSWELIQAAVDKVDVELTVRPADSSKTARVVLRTSRADPQMVDASLLRQVGLIAPWSAPVLGDISPAGAAEAAGLKRGDQVLQVSGTKITEAQQLREIIRGAPLQAQTWVVLRRGQWQEIVVTPAAVTTDSGVKGEYASAAPIGRIGAQVGSAPASTDLSYSLFESVRRGVDKTWSYSVLTVQMFGRMLIGQASLKNLSGPLTIADYAGKSANAGITPFLLFLAMVSVSLGVLNLLPLPVLDGGHLMYYLWEALTGRGVPDVWQERLQRAGVTALVMLMSVAMFNDLSRLFGLGF